MNKLKLSFAIISIVTLSSTGAYFMLGTKAESSLPSGLSWNLFWSDEFNGTSLNTNDWKAYYNTYGDGNKEEACLTPNNVNVSNGSLKITSKREVITCPGQPTDQFSSGFISSKEVSKYYPAFAKYEIRAKVSHGQGVWPAFWLRHVNGASTAEVDILEIFHASNPGYAKQTLHIPNELSTNLKSGKKYIESPISTLGGWHTYSVELIPLENNTKAQLDFYIDGNLNFSYIPAKFGWLNDFNKNAMFDIAINQAVGGNWVGHPDDPFAFSRYLGKCFNKWPIYDQPCIDTAGVLRAQFPSVYEVDYVRVYTPEVTKQLKAADINSDYKIDLQDFDILKANWMKNTVSVDINKDGIVGPADLSMLLGDWGNY